ncbi:hypothetical protein [Streptomyces sp. NPDC059850]|uniref:hypothetical protein n=1 Tax=Streptomyces sp. NPDC059850 TaxID=3346970 RepID=UPI00364827F6
MPEERFRVDVEHSYDVITGAVEEVTDVFLQIDPNKAVGGNVVPYDDARGLQVLTLTEWDEITLTTSVHDTAPPLDTTPWSWIREVSLLAEPGGTGPPPDEDDPEPDQHDPHTALAEVWSFGEKGADLHAEPKLPCPDTTPRWFRARIHGRTDQPPPEPYEDHLIQLWPQPPTPPEDLHPQRG